MKGQVGKEQEPSGDQHLSHNLDTAGEVGVSGSSWAAVEAKSTGEPGWGAAFELTRGPPFPILTGGLNAGHIKQGALPRSDTNPLWKWLGSPGGQPGS